MAKWFVAFLAISIFLHNTQTLSHAEAPASPSVEYQIKASLIFNILSFVKWPPAAEGDSPHSLTVCMAGGNPFGTALKPLEDLLIRGERLVFMEVFDVTNEGLSGCRVLFVTGTSKAGFGQVLHRMQSQPVLTIGEHPEFLAAGGIINFRIVDNRLAFEISRKAALNARLEISSKLLRMAKYVEE